MSGEHLMGVADIEEDGVVVEVDSKKFVDCETQTHAKDFVPLLKRKSATVERIPPSDCDGEETAEKKKMSFARSEETCGEKEEVKTNYKEIFKEIFTVLSKVRAETERV